jgi:dTDP-4-dehydrorhamnose 3,5-epimerase
MKFMTTSIPDVILVEPHAFSDGRGFFMETFRSDEMSKAGVSGPFIQDNHSGSRKNTLRGLHYQVCRPQGKLVRVAHGEIFDVAVDLRRGSPTYSYWVAEILSSDNRKMLWIPPGFAHGLYVLSDWADVLYKATDYYAPEWERTLLWNDPAVAIRWPIPAGVEPLLSSKDAAGTRLERAEVFE